MGRITIFTAEDVHSKIIQNELERLSLPYTEISLIDFPSCRNDLKAMICKTSVPQVFSNTRHVGGVTATLEALIQDLPHLRLCQKHHKATIN